MKDRQNMFWEHFMRRILEAPKAPDDKKKKIKERIDDSLIFES
jgi:hypothetical protein